MKRRVIPQFDLPSMERVFNLRIETATDGARVQRERQERERARLEAESRQQDFTKTVNRP